MAKIETKVIKHDFSNAEKQQRGEELARTIAELRGVETEFDGVKADYKAKIESKKTQIESLGTAVVNGFEMRNVRCRVEFLPKIRKKHFYPENADEGAKPVLVEDMTSEDFALELIEAESKFDTREEITLFPATERDNGILVVGRYHGKWYSALRITIGKHRIDERMNSESRAYKQRVDAINTAAKRALTWLSETLGKDAGKGFADPINKAIEPHKERAE